MSPRRSPLLPWKRLLATLPRRRVPLLPQQVYFQTETSRTGPPPLAASLRVLRVHGSRVEPDSLRGKGRRLFNTGNRLEGGSHPAEKSRGARNGTADAIDRRVADGVLGRAGEGDASATRLTAGVPAGVALREKQLEEEEKQEKGRSSDEPKHPPKSPNAVAMEEFAALERKLAASAAPGALAHPTTVETVKGKAKKSPEQVAMEEFAALERKLGGAERVEAGSPREARSVSLARPEEPQAEECCGNGCQNCVWIDYWEDLQAWEEAERERELDREKSRP